MSQSVSVLRSLVEPENKIISISRQCSWINLLRSSWYYHPDNNRDEELRIMNQIDRIYTRYPFYGVPRMTAELRRQGEIINHKRVERLMHLMGIEALMPRRNLSRRNKDHVVYPYLLKDVQVTGTNQVWSSDITYIPIHISFMYLVAIIDWFSRYILSWEISNTLDVHFCLSALDKALRRGKPEIFNTDQGSQFTSKDFSEAVLNNQIKLSMDSKGRALDNIFIERFWKSLKYEDIYLNDYQSVPELIAGIKNYFSFYNNDRVHQSLNYKTPSQIYFAGQ